MSYNFSPEKNEHNNSNLIPAGSLTWALLTVTEFKDSQNTGGLMAALDFICYGGLWEGRKISNMNILDPRDDRHSEAGRNMGFGAMLHLVEACGLVDVKDPNSYAWLNITPFKEIIMRLDGKVAGIQVSIKKDAGGAYPDKNQVGEYLTPNPARGRANKGWVALTEGKNSLRPTVPAGAPAAQSGQSGFGQPAPQSGAASPGAGFGAAKPATPAPAQQPSQGFGAAPAAPLAQPSGQVGATPAWLANNQPDKTSAAQSQPAQPEQAPMTDAELAAAQQAAEQTAQRVGDIPA